jgi:hypothetical protein
MRQVRAYFKYKVTWWVDHSNAEGRAVTTELGEGLRVYAEDQAQLQVDIACKFEAKWEVLCQDGVTTKELDRLAMVVEGDNDKLDGAETGSEEEEFDSAEENDVTNDDREE